MHSFLRLPAAALTVMLSAPQVAYLSGTVIDMDAGGQFRR